MAKSKVNEGGAAVRGNGFDPNVTQSFVDRIERLKADIASETGAHMKRCRDIRENIDDVYDEAKNAGIPKKELKRVIKRRDLEAQIESLDSEGEGESQDTYDQLRHALGGLDETGLGRAARDKHPAPADEKAQYDAGLKDGKAAKTAPKDASQHYMRGWHHGTGANIGQTPEQVDAALALNEEWPDDRDIKRAAPVAELTH